jgi:hypothetical protein
MPARAAQEHRNVTAHEARAWLVDYVATCQRDAAGSSLEVARALREVVDDLAVLLRRWDIIADCDHSPH